MKKNKTTKIIVTICFIVSLLVTLKLWISFSLNEMFISKYERNIYDNSPVQAMMLMNFPEGYIAHYNLGNYYYETNSMIAAEKEYQEALKTVPDSRVCDVRLNLGLTMTAMLSDNSDNIKNDIEKILDVLLENDCANKNGNGRHAGAQQLYNVLIKILNGVDVIDNGGTDTDGDPERDESEMSEEELEEWLQKQAEESQYEHNNDYYSGEEYEYYNGKTW